MFAPPLTSNVLGLIIVSIACMGRPKAKEYRGEAGEIRRRTWIGK
jgi:hypothetical protein